MKWLFAIVFLPAGILFVCAGAALALKWLIFSVLILFLLGVIYIASAIICWFVPYLCTFRFARFKKKRCSELFALVSSNDLAANSTGTYRLPKVCANLTCTGYIFITRGESDLLTIFFQTVQGYIPNKSYCSGYLICNRTLKVEDLYVSNDKVNPNRINIDCFESDLLHNGTTKASAESADGEAKQASVSEPVNNFRWQDTKAKFPFIIDNKLHSTFAILRRIDPKIYYCQRDDMFYENAFTAYCKASVK